MAQLGLSSTLERQNMVVSSGGGPPPPPPEVWWVVDEFGEPVYDENGELIPKT